MARVLKTRKHLKIWLFPALFIAICVGAGIGAVWGRIITIDCNRTENLCTVNSRGYLYPIDEFQMPIDGIRNLEVYGTENSYRRQGGGGGMSWVNTEYDIHLEWEPASQQSDRDSADLKVRDFFSYKDPVLKASKDLAAFLNNPAQNEINIEYGTYRTGFVFSSVFVIMLSLFVLSNGIWRIRMRASEGQVWKGLADGTDDKTQIKRISIVVGIYKGIRGGSQRSPTISISRYMYEGTQYQITDSIRLTHPWGAEEVRDTAIDRFPRGMPKVFKKELDAFLAETTRTFFPAQ